MDNLTDQQALRAMMRTATQTREVALKTYLARLPEMKTVDAFQRQMWRAVRDLYSRRIDEFAFIDETTGAIENQLNKAWRHGALDVNIDHADFTPEDYDHLDTIIKNEYEYIPRLAQDILDARNTGVEVDTFKIRVDLWVNRYNEVVNEARVWFGKKTRLEWQLGPTEEHCHTGDRPGKVGCVELAGIVAFAEEWAQSGFRTQQPGEDSPLSCGGWHCACQLQPTTKRRTRNALTRLLDMRLKANGL